MLSEDLTGLVKQFSQLPQVEAIALAGSHTTSMNDSLSDYDLYIYVSQPIEQAAKTAIFEKYCSYMEHNQFWEAEDDGYLKCGTELEIIYRDLSWLESELNRVVLEHQANVGYSTCFWANLLSSEVLYDREEKLTKLKERFSVPYSDELKQSIINKNLPLISDSMPAYPKQVSKALKRQDRISVHHRVTEYLASYFDILFAANKLAHPGEKRLVAYTLAHCQSVPENFEERISNILSMAGSCDEKLVDELTLAGRELEPLL